MYDTVRDRLIHLHHCRGAGWKTIHSLLKADPTLTAPFSLPPNDLRPLIPLSDAQWTAFFHDLHSIDVQGIVKSLSSTLTVFS
ncbi:hypothetical protein RA955_08705 [Geobacillus proteiniphilus]|uniref:Mobile element protein n=1 Tax=Geobacillus proteiniphilus TaxID=860353 RepID=A0ABY9MJ51_9BACL|nr:hypothetical protein [Geobacillus proteiniphilus]WMJ18076.1 hypothetical protein RA955_08705 [Geobacillus proteiniphilus]